MVRVEKKRRDERPGLCRGCLAPVAGRWLPNDRRDGQREKESSQRPALRTLVKEGAGLLKESGAYTPLRDTVAVVTLEPAEKERLKCTNEEDKEAPGCERSRGTEKEKKKEKERHSTRSRVRRGAVLILSCWETQLPSTS